MKKGRHRRFEEARKLKQSGPDFLFNEPTRTDHSDSDADEDDDDYAALARKYGAGAGVVALVIGVVGMTSADASPGDGPYTGANIVDGTLWMSDLSPAANQAYLNTYDNTVRSISVTSSGRSSMSNTMSCTSG